MEYEVKIHAPKNLSEKWYVYIYHNQKVIKKFYKGLASAPTFTERMIKAEALKSVVEKEIKTGWKPINTKLPQPYLTELTVEEAYNKALQLVYNSKLESGTKSIYKSHHKSFLEAVKALKWEDVPFAELEMYHFSVILDKMTEIKGFGNSYFNNNLAYCKALGKHLKNAFIIKENKTLGIPIKKHKTKDKILLTAEQQTKIIQHFNTICPSFNVYLKCLYHLAIRPKELHLLQCYMLKKNKNIWYFELPENITKNDKKSILPIPPDLKRDFEKYDFSNPEYYIFGKNFEPSPKALYRDAPNALWRREVKGVLNIQSDMYWLKSKSSNDKMRNGMSLDAVRIANRHSDAEITKIYATESDIITLEQNLDKFGEFK